MLHELARLFVIVYIDYKEWMTEQFVEWMAQVTQLFFYSYLFQ
jgi:hypothetical protein